MKYFKTNKIFAEWTILLNERGYYWTNDFPKRTIFLNERSVSKTSEIYDKMNDVSENEWKRSLTNDEQTSWRKKNEFCAQSDLKVSSSHNQISMS